jgi:fructose-1,6-bisphosphatase I
VVSVTDKVPSLLCHALQFSFKSIAYYIRRATLINLTGLAGSSNTTGDDQKKLDVIGNDVFVAAMRSSGKCRLLVSEEEEECIVFDEHPNARYAVACDPIDGSSNLDAGVSVGTIFAIYRLPDGAKGTKEDMLIPGTELVAAGFTMYGASAQLVLTMKGGSVNGFTLDNALGEFILTHPDMRVPRKRSIYSVNEGNSLYWEDPVKEYFNSLKFPIGEGEKPYSGRYIGSMVADAYRTLLYGGIFAYPADKKSPKGKLRILYECAPMAMVFENGTLSRRSSGGVLLTLVQLADSRSTARWIACSRWCQSTSTTVRAYSSAATTRCKRSSTRTRSTRSRDVARDRHSSYTHTHIYIYSTTVCKKAKHRCIMCDGTRPQGQQTSCAALCWRLIYGRHQLGPMRFRGGNAFESQLRQGSLRPPD